MNRRFAAYIFVIAALCSAGLGALECSFIIDHSPPYIAAGSAFPPADTTLADTFVTIIFALDDRGAGVWGDSVLTTVIVNGTDSTDYPATPLIPGDFSPGDTVEVCIRAIDRIFDTLACTCPPNELDTCWRFFIEPACSSRFDSLWFVEEADCDSINIVEICYRLESTCEPPWNIGISASSDGGAGWGVPMSSLIGDFGHLGTVSDTGIHCFQWLLSDDFPDFEGCNFQTRIVGDSITPLISIGCLDSRAPVVSIACPADTVFYGDTLVLHWTIDDSFWSHDECSLFIGFCGEIDTIILTDTVFTWPVPPVSCDSAWARIAVRDGFCNWGFDSCSFRTFACAAGPMAQIVYPDSCGYITTCADQGVSWLVFDTSGHAIDPATFTLRIQVSGRGGVLDTIIHAPNPALIWDGASRLDFDPSAIPMAFASWDTVIITLVSAYSDIGCPIEKPIECSFLVDLDPPVVLGGFSPPPGTVFEDYPVSFTLGAEVIDSICPHFTSLFALEHWREDSLLGIYFFVRSTFVDFYYAENGDSLRICVIDIADWPGYDYCPPNTAPDTCWWVYVEFSGGPTARIIEPVDLDSSGFAVSACDCQPIILAIHDEDGIDTSSIRFEVEGIVYDIATPELSWDGESLLVFTPTAPCWESGDTMHFSLLAAEDVHGTPLVSVVSSRFIADYNEPAISMTSPETATESEFELAFEAIDSLCGISAIDSIVIYRNGLYDTTAFSTSAVFLDSLLNGDSLSACVFAEDNCADYCGPNISERCFDVFVEIGDFSAYVIAPTDIDGDGRIISSCECPEIIWYIGTEIPIIDSLITLFVGEEVWTAEDSVFQYFAVGESLVWNADGSVCFDDGEIVPFHLLLLVDESGDSFTAAIGDTMIIDLSPPVVEFASPFPSTSSRSPIIKILPNDLLGGVDFTSFALSAGGIDGGAGSPYTSLSGDTIVFDIGLSPDSFAYGDTVLVELTIWDIVDYCEPNRLDTSWSFVIADTVPPEAILLSPFIGAGSACADQRVEWFLSDGETGIDSTRIWVSADGAVFSALDPALELDFTGVLVFTPLSDWVEGAHSVCLDSVYDLFGNALPAAVCADFTIDLSPPEVVFLEPPCSSVLRDSLAGIIFALADDLSPVYFGRTWLILGADSLPITSDTTAITPAIIDTVWRDGDTVRYCVYTADSADFCTGENDTLACCEFYIELSALSAEAIYPLDGAATSCSLQTAVWFFSGAATRDYIHVVLNDTSDFTSHSAEISFAGDSLFFTPISPWINGDTIELCLVDAADSFGVHIEDTVCVVFVVDLAPPVFADPTPTGAIAEIAPSIRLRLWDEIAGLDSDSIEMTIDGAVVGASLSDDTLGFEPSDIGMFWLGGDTVTVCVRAADLALYCGANADLLCWEFFIVTGGPEIAVVEPAADSLWSACLGQGAALTLFDPEGIDTASIGLTVNGEASTEWVFRGDSLFYMPAGGPLDGDTITVCVRASDMLGNPSDSAVCVTYLVDYSPPAVVSIVPAPGSLIGAGITISVFLADSGSGIAESSLSLIVNGSRYFPGDGYLSWNGAELNLIPESSFVPGEEVLVCLDSILDSPDLCEPNALDSCWLYNVELLPDLWTSGEFVSLSPSTVSEGDSFVFEGIGFYSGTGVLPGTFVEIRAGASVLKSTEYIGLAPGDTIRESLVISSLEPNILSGAPICLALDAYDNIFESNEANNSACASLDIVSKDCSARPNPFSPNSDLVNDEVKFTYPGMSLEGAKIEIYDARGRLAAKLEDISSWDGRDLAGNPLPKGIYVYLVIRGGEVLCKGTVHIAR